MHLRGMKASCYRHSQSQQTSKPNHASIAWAIYACIRGESGEFFEAHST